MYFCTKEAGMVTSVEYLVSVSPIIFVTLATIIKKQQTTNKHKDNLYSESGGGKNLNLSSCRLFGGTSEASPPTTQPIQVKNYPFCKYHLGGKTDWSRWTFDIAPLESCEGMHFSEFQPSFKIKEWQSLTFIKINYYSFVRGRTAFPRDDFDQEGPEF